MDKGASKVKKKDVDMKELGEKLLKFVQENSPEKMEFDIILAKKAFGHSRNIIIEAYALGPEELKKYKIVENKASSPSKDVEPPCLNSKGTITIKKQYVGDYNKQYPSNEIVEGNSFDVTFEDGKIILVKK